MSTKTKDVKPSTSALAITIDKIGELNDYLLKVLSSNAQATLNVARDTMKVELAKATATQLAEDKVIADATAAMKVAAVATRKAYLNAAPAANKAKSVLSGEGVKQGTYKLFLDLHFALTDSQHRMLRIAQNVSTAPAEVRKHYLDGTIDAFTCERIAKSSLSAAVLTVAEEVDSDKALSAKVKDVLTFVKDNTTNGKLTRKLTSKNVKEHASEGNGEGTGNVREPEPPTSNHLTADTRKTLTDSLKEPGVRGTVREAAVRFVLDIADYGYERAWTNLNGHKAVKAAK